MHRDRQGRSPAPAMSHRPAGRKRAQQAAPGSTTRRAEAPELPRLRALEAQAASIPISSSAASSTSPRSGSSRVHPYPVGEAADGSSFELVPSVATRAAQSWEQGESMEVTPIREAEASPITPPKPIHKLGNESCARTFLCTNFLNTPPGSGTSRTNSWDRFLPSKRKEDKLSREGTNFSTHTPSRGRPPPHSGVQTQKVNLCALFFLA